MCDKRCGLVALLLLAVVATVVACGDDDDGADDAEIGEVGAASETATDAWARDGVEGLYDHLSDEIKGNCSEEQVSTALGPVEPTGWRQSRNIALEGDDTARATVIVITANGDIEQDWEFVREGDDWLVSSMPGLLDCTLP